MKYNIFSFISSFFDTMGVSGFASMNFYLKEVKKEDVKNIPAYLNMFFCLPTILQAILFVSFININLYTLGILTIAGILGSYFGVRYYTKLNARSIKLIMSIGLFCTALLLLYNIMFGYVSLNVLTGLIGFKLILGFIAILLFNFAEALGIGSYAPSIAMLFLLGMDLKAIFPIITLSSAIDMPFICLFNINNNIQVPKYIMYAMPFALAGVLISFYFFLSMNVVILKFAIILLLVYTSIKYLKEVICEDC